MYTFERVSPRGKWFVSKEGKIGNFVVLGFGLPREFEPGPITAAQGRAPPGQKYVYINLARPTPEASISEQRLRGQQVFFCLPEAYAVKNALLQTFSNKESSMREGPNACLSFLHEIGYSLKITREPFGVEFFS